MIMSMPPFALTVEKSPSYACTAQCKAACYRFPYTLRATGHENTLAFELTTKNGKWIAVCHGPSKRNDGSTHALAASKLGTSAITIPLDGIALQTLKTTVVDDDLDLVTLRRLPESCPSKSSAPPHLGVFVRVNIKWVLISGVLLE
jgi:hypothetical protein